MRGIIKNLYLMSMDTINLSSDFTVSFSLRFRGIFVLQSFPLSGGFSSRCTDSMAICKIGRASREAGGVKVGVQKTGGTYIKSRRPYVKIGRQSVKPGGHL